MRGLEQLWWLLAANLFCARLLPLVWVLFQEVQLWVLIQFTPFLSFHTGVRALLNRSGKYECINLLSACANLNINVPAVVFTSADETFSGPVSFATFEWIGILFILFRRLVLTWYT